MIPRRGSLQIGRPFGIPIQVHWSFLLLFAFLAFQGAAIGGVSGLLITAFQTIAIFTFVTLHELGHALTAIRGFGIGVRRITLWPLGGVAEIDMGRLSPRAEFWITAAGPAVNFALAIVLTPLAVAGHILAGWTLPIWMVAANLILGVFNLLPAFPMDGGRLLRAFLSARRRDHLSATETAVSIGKSIAIAIGVAGLFFNPFLIVLAFFAYQLGQRELEAARWQTPAATAFGSVPPQGRPIHVTWSADPRQVEAMEAQLRAFLYGGLDPRQRRRF